MTLATHADPLKLQYLVQKLHDAFGFVSDGEVLAARKKALLQEAKDGLWLSLANVMKTLKTKNGRLDRVGSDFSS